MWAARGTSGRQTDLSWAVKNAWYVTKDGMWLKPEFLVAPAGFDRIQRWDLDRGMSLKAQCRRSYFGVDSGGQGV